MHCWWIEIFRKKSEIKNWSIECKKRIEEKKEQYWRRSLLTNSFELAEKENRRKKQKAFGRLFQNNLKYAILIFSNLSTFLFI